MEDLTRAIEVFVSLNLIALGASYVLRPAAWRGFLANLQEKGEGGALILSLFTFGIGSFIIAFHRVWGGVPTIITVYGWLALAKGAFNVLLPGVALKGIERGLRLGVGAWRAGGAITLVLGVVVLQHALQA